MTEAPPSGPELFLVLDAADPVAEVDRLRSLGATVLGQNSLGENHWTCLADPEGNVFDVARNA